MTKEVKIISVDKGHITAGCDRNACEGCKGSLFCKGRNSEFEVLNPNNLSVEDGDSVEISMPAGRTIFATAMSLAFPLLCFLFGMVAAYLASSEREIMQLLCGVAGLAFGFIISSIYFHFTKKKYTPSIERKTD